jgi:hypothetical protein
MLSAYDYWNTSVGWLIQVENGPKGFQANRYGYGKVFMFWLGGWASRLTVQCRKSVGNRKRRVNRKIQIIRMLKVM